MTQIAEYTRGRRDGYRWAITWLHERAREMNDPHAKGILNTAAFNMGVQLKTNGVLPDRDSSLTAPAKEKP